MYSNAYVWSRVLSYLEQHSPAVAVSSYFDDAEVVELSESKLVIYSPSPFRKDVILNRYTELIRQAMQELFQTDVELIVLDEDELPQYTMTKRKRTFVEFNSQYTFDTFVVGSSNKHAFSAAEAVAEERTTAYNPLFIYGQSGLGKTHLLYAIANRIQQKHPDYNIVYIKGDQFINEFLEALRIGKNFEFRDKYRNADLFLIDDIQFIAGKNSTQEEFFHTFNALTQDGKQIVLSSDRPPKDMPQLEDRMRTRFEWGLLADVQPPDLETRMLIVKRKADALNFDISDDVVEYIAQKLKNNIRQLESAVKKMQAYVQIQGAHVNTATAQQAIRDILSDNKPIPVVVDKIITEVARTYGANPEDLRSKKKDAQTSKYRQISMYIVREVTGLSAKAIGAEFGGRHYSTVLYALDEIKKESDTDSALRTTINDIIKNVQES